MDLHLPRPGECIHGFLMLDSSASARPAGDPLAWVARSLVGPDRERAWRTLDASLHRSAVALCERLGLQGADAEDVYQTVLANLFRGARTFRYDGGRGEFRRYVLRSVRNEATRCRARRAIERRQEGSLTTPVIDPWAALVERDWRRTRLRSAGRELAAHHGRRTLRICRSLLRGAPVEAVAARHRVSVASAYKIKARVLARAREAVAREVRREA